MHLTQMLDRTVLNAEAPKQWAFFSLNILQLYNALYFLYISKEEEEEEDSYILPMLIFLMIIFYL